MLFQLSDVQHEFERKDYNLMSLLADFGGFNDGVFLLTSFFMAAYSSSMFAGSFAQQFHVRRKKSKDEFSNLQGGTQTLSEALKRG